jgi:hypothetical protein
MSEDNRSSPNAQVSDGSPCLARVVSVVDQTYNGILEVQLMREVGGNEKSGAQIRQVKYLSPFYGVTKYDFMGNSPDTHNETQKSYGFWMIPPDVGSYVVVIFLNGDEKKGYWIGAPVMEQNMNFSTPGFAATEYIVDESRETDREKTRVPGTEYNKKIHEGNEDGTKKPKPEHPFAKFLEKQGLLKDDTRGITTSSARREVPSMVFGISTPGPTDKSGKTGKVGKAESEINNAFVSRLGGSSFVMDDGDDKWERAVHPSEGPPDYKNVEEGETGLRDRPHNELFRLRTRTGHQILMHNSEDLIYICNSRGTAWIELTSDGKIDVFAEDSISIRTKQDFNFICDRDFNLEVFQNFNIKVHGEMHTHVLKDQVLIVDKDQKIHIRARKDETIEEEYRQTVNDHVKKYYATDYTHNIDGRMDWRVAKGVSFTAGQGASGAQFAPFTPREDDPGNPVANDGDITTPVEDVNGATPDRVDVIINKDMRIWHINGHNVDHHITGYVKTQVDGDYDLKTESTYEHTNQGGMDIRVEGGHYQLFSQSEMNIHTNSTLKVHSDSNMDVHTPANYTLFSGANMDMKAGGHVYTTSGGTNETKAGGNIIETAPQIHMNGPGAATAATAAEAPEATPAEPPEHPEEARISAKGTLFCELKTISMPEIPSQDAWESLTTRDVIMRRMPTPEPYPHHEHLDPELVKPEPTQRDHYDPRGTSAPFRYKGADEKEVASHWRKYTTSIDTFKRNPPVEAASDDEGSWG